MRERVARDRDVGRLEHLHQGLLYALSLMPVSELVQRFPGDAPAAAQDLEIVDGAAHVAAAPPGQRLQDLCMVGYPLGVAYPLEDGKERCRGDLPELDHLAARSEGGVFGVPGIGDG